MATVAVVLDRDGAEGWAEADPGSEGMEAQGFVISNANVDLVDFPSIIEESDPFVYEIVFSGSVPI